MNNGKDEDRITTYRSYQEIIRDADAERAAENARRDRAGDRGILLVLVVTVCILGIAFAF